MNLNIDDFKLIVASNQEINNTITAFEQRLDQTQKEIKVIEVERAQRIEME